jgi:hypothetical protein
MVIPNQNIPKHPINSCPRVLFALKTIHHKNPYTQITYEKLCELFIRKTSNGFVSHDPGECSRVHLHGCDMFWGIDYIIDVVNLVCTN